MGKIEYKVSVIIPLYNQEKNIRKCIRSLKKQTISFSSLEIILVNDGSEDSSADICKMYERKYQNVIYIEQKNKGVSSARNQGISKATGKYIFFLDADDVLERHTIYKVSNFFDSVYNEVDLVTYRIETIYQGKVLPPHFRYQYLKESGIYDLCQYPYVGQTTMNMVIRNKFSDNILFDEKQTFSEDQKYCCQILSEKLKMGFCKDGKYVYYRSQSSSSGNLTGACYIFEQCTSLFEELFSKYSEKVPVAFQGLYINDIYWKLISNILFPYHYNSNEFVHAFYRIKRLLSRCEDDVILNHPNIDFFEKYYFLKLKGNSNITTNIQKDFFELLDNGKMVVHEESMEIVITKIRCNKGKIEIDGFLKSVFLQFYSDNPILCAVENEGELIKKISLYSSTHNYYLSHEKTQNFKAFTYRANLDVVKKVYFKVGIGGYWYSTHFYFMPEIPLCSFATKKQFQRSNYIISLDNNTFLFNKNVLTKKKEEIWLYYDCVGMAWNNGYLQFEHDYQKNDGIKRYYIITDKKQLKNKGILKKGVFFGSKKHKTLLKKCSKIITAYIEEANLLPYKKNNYQKVNMIFDFEIIYLQHGVLHIIMPWKYSKEKNLADRIVVSTKEETSLYLQNGYQKENLIKTGMPRFEKLKKTKVTKKILYAPSWRAYLIGDYCNRHWMPLNSKFLDSKFYKEVSGFLESKELLEFLQNYGFCLDIKLHPIFNVYKKFFNINRNHINFVDGEINEGNYDLFITDYSSYAYDFSYLSIPILYFIPDEIEFKCGMNGYRELNYTEEFWENALYSKNELIDKIKKTLVDGEKNISYGTFYQCDNICEKIYNELRK